MTLRRRSAAPALVYGGTETHVRKGINVFGWNAVGKVLPFESLRAVSGVEPQ